MVYKWYILPIGWLYITYHLLGEPETTIETCWVSYCTIDYNLLLSGSPICKHTHTAWVYLIPVGKGWEQGGWLNGHGEHSIHLQCFIFMDAGFLEVWRPTCLTYGHLFQDQICRTFPHALPETDMAPENRSSQKKNHLPASDFQVLWF